MDYRYSYPKWMFAAIFVAVFALLFIGGACLIGYAFTPIDRDAVVVPSDGNRTIVYDGTDGGIEQIEYNNKTYDNVDTMTVYPNGSMEFKTSDDDIHVISGVGGFALCVLMGAIGMFLITCIRDDVHKNVRNYPFFGEVTEAKFRWCVETILHDWLSRCKTRKQKQMLVASIAERMSCRTQISCASSFNYTEFDEFEVDNDGILSKSNIWPRVKTYYRSHHVGCNQTIKELLHENRYEDRPSNKKKVAA